MKRGLLEWYPWIQRFCWWVSR